ncbi:MAG: patatin-like phospholipase family protein [Puniceicoccales bacterium]|jgi:predicted acylesterase/phospholipase RssA|nr:patatin-like phospholipase family protein [Puniceicoccales bacterium]
MDVRMSSGIDRMSQFMGTEKALQNSGSEVFKHFSQVYATTQNEFLKRKLGECVSVIAKIDLTEMNASALKKFDKKAENWLHHIKSLGEKVGDNISQNMEQQIDAAIRDAGEDLQAFVNENSTKLSESSEKPRAEPTDITWTKTVQQARLGNKIPKSVLKNLPQMCEKVFQKKIEALKQRIPAEQLGNLQEEIHNFSSHLSETAKVIQNDGNYDARMQIICLDVLVDDLVLALENKFNPKSSHQEAPPMIARVGDKFVLQQEVAIENLCLRGGGGKGFGYAGALAALTQAGKLDRLKAVSGSSAGAIAAVAIGFGTRPEALGSFCDEIQAGVAKRKSKEAMKNYPALEGMFSGLGVMGNAAGVIQAIDEVTAKNTKEFLQKPEVRDFLSHKNGVFQPYELNRLRNLMAEVTFPREESAMLTFKDLELLRRIRGEGIENNFKAITLTGWDATAQKEVYFDAKNTSDMPIAYATRISMALPGAFNAVEMNLTKYQPGGIQVQSPHKFMDGGLGSNSPTEIFIKPLTHSSTEEERIQHQKAQASTLTCVFDEGGKAFSMDSSKFSHGENWITRAFLWLLGAIKSTLNMSALRNDENKKLNDAGNIMVVGHGQLGTLSMSPTTEERNAVDLMSNLMAVDWVRQQGDGEVQIESSSLDALLKELSLENLRKMKVSDEEIQAVIQSEIQRRETDSKGH